MIPPILDTPTPTAKIKRPLPQDGPICLNLGGVGEGFVSGKIPGHVIVDLRDSEETDVISDISDLSWVQDRTVDSIYCSNALEHFQIHRTIEVLKEWYRVLKPGGKLYVSVPDFDAVVKLYQKFGLTRWVQYILWGDQKSPLNYHYVIFTLGTLSGLMIEAGFRDVKRVKEFPFGVKDASSHTDNYLNMPVSLNVEAIK